MNVNWGHIVLASVFSVCVTVAAIYFNNAWLLAWYVIMIFVQDAMMKCPYNRKSETHAQAWFQIPNSDGAVVRGITMDQWAYEQDECPKEQCDVDVAIHVQTVISYK